MARIPRLFARRARSIASIERGTPSGSEWACISIAPARVCVIAGIASSDKRAAEISHGIFITLEDYCRLSIFPGGEIIGLVLEALKEQITRRRALLITPFAFAGLVAISSRKGRDSGDSVSANDSNSEVVIVPFTDAGERLAPVTVKKLVRPDAEWRKLLDAEQYYVTRRQGTDTAFTGTYYQLHEPGLFRCICCGNALFSSDAKFDSGTGWPRFSAAITEENIHTHKNVSMFIERVEVECKRCDAHLGHVFTDGPEPAYLRYCINESSLTFVRHARLSRTPS